MQISNENSWWLDVSSSTRICMAEASQYIRIINCSHRLIRRIWQRLRHVYNACYKATAMRLWVSLLARERGCNRRCLIAPQSDGLAGIHSRHGSDHTWFGYCIPAEKTRVEACHRIIQRTPVAPGGYRSWLVYSHEDPAGKVVALLVAWWWLIHSEWTRHDGPTNHHPQVTEARDHVTNSHRPSGIHQVQTPCQIGSLVAWHL